MSVTIEVKEASKAQKEDLKIYGPIEILEDNIINVTCPDSLCDDLTDWLEGQNLEWRLV